MKEGLVLALEPRKVSGGNADKMQYKGARPLERHFPWRKQSCYKTWPWEDASPSPVVMFVLPTGWALYPRAEGGEARRAVPDLGLCESLQG